MKPYIRQVIVVEGMHDSAHLKKYFDCETIVTGGLGIDDKIMKQIKEAAEQSGIIVFTDPDGPGKMIRRKIEAVIPDCMHAYVMKEDARTKHKVGVEHAPFGVLQEALACAAVQKKPESLSITMAEFYDLGLVGQAGSEAQRRKVSRAFHIGEGNAKYLREMLNRRGITADEIRKILEEDE